MSKPITPSWRDLIDKTDDELRETLSELNAPSLRYLARTMVQAIVEHKDYIRFQEDEKVELLHRLKKIGEIVYKK